MVLRLRSSLCELQLGRKNRQRLNVILQSRTTLKDSYILNLILQMEARQSPLMLPSCLEAHGTPSHENGDHAPCNPPLYPPPSADTRDDAALGVVLGVDARTRKERRKKEKIKEKWRKRRTTGKVRQVFNRGDVQVGALRGQGCTDGARLWSEISVSSSILRQYDI